jgi:hypothetical protein
VPLVILVDGFRLFFYSNEGAPREPIHVHVRRAECELKVWIDPAIRPEEPFGFNSSEVRAIIEHVTTHEALIRRRWHEHFGS